MVIALPRSATTWCSNWLTTDTTLCLHDPLAHRHYSEWDEIVNNKTLGIADTGISQFYQWLNAHPARKVILHRDRNEIAESLGLPEFLDAPSYLDQVSGMHCHWREVFDRPAPIYEFLTRKPFDADRHNELKAIQMAPLDAVMTVDKEVMRRLIREIKEIANA